VGEVLTLFRPEFNRSLVVEARPERLTQESGAVLLREVMDRLGLSRWLEERLTDTRNPALITHRLPELLRTSLFLLAQGWRDQDDAGTLRHDPALRLAVSERRGVGPLERREVPPGQRLSKNPPVPDGLASQPTLSRLVAMLSTAHNRVVLRDSLLEAAARRVRALRRGHRPRSLTIDVDSLPIEVHGHQPGSAHNGHYHARIYHPLIALVAETGDVLDAELREGSVHTAAGSVEFILPLIETVERKLCQVAAVRLDAGFPEEKLLSALEFNGTPYVARVRNNAALDRLAEPFLRRPPGRRPHEPRTWLHEMSYRAESWSKERRVVLVVLERPDELFLHHFWLITSWTADQVDAGALLERYRERGTAEGHIGEIKDVLDPALSSSPRPKSHYRQTALERRDSSADSFAHNEVLLLLNLLAYNLGHAVRVLVERATGQGMSLRRVRERVLRVAGRILVHGRRATLVVAESAVSLWSSLWRRLAALHFA
jgi:hypothetical protein